VGVSVDHQHVLRRFTEAERVRHPLLSNFGRKMLPAYGALVTDQTSPIFHYAKRAYFVLDRNGVVRWAKVQDNPLDLLQPDEVLKAVRESGAS
jgi:peroxiredoxin